MNKAMKNQYPQAIFADQFWKPFSMRHKIQFCEKLEVFMKIITSERKKIDSTPLREPKATKLLGEVLRDFVVSTQVEKPHIIKNEVVLGNGKRIDLQIDNEYGIEFWIEEALNSFKKQHFNRDYSDYFPVLYIEYSQKSGAFTNIFEQKRYKREILTLRGSLSNIFKQIGKLESSRVLKKDPQQFIHTIKKNSVDFLPKSEVKYLFQHWQIFSKKIEKLHWNSNVGFSKNLGLRLKSKEIYEFTDKNKPKVMINLKQEVQKEKRKDGKEKLKFSRRVKKKYYGIFIRKSLKVVRYEVQERGDDYFSKGWRMNIKNKGLLKQ